MSTFAERLRVARKRKGVTQQWVADRIHVHRTSYTKYEVGAVEPSFEVCRRLCLALEVTPNELLGWETRVQAEPLSEEEMQQALLPWPKCLPAEERRRAVEAVKTFLLESAEGDS